ncbi:MAG: HAMP domain-containing protein [Bacteroidetes bacterium]|nr:HAMP domain-containing protein [Bacteroidota bacterium]MBU1116457.1 HAMP domain-containing protein [Bacteroidota bacterium]MBU1800037.1 HAMP domain-containing protein [Bacteroidota bacterium]
MKIFNKIGTRLILAVSFTVIVIISVFAYFNIQSHSNNLISEVERHANQLSETVKNTMQFDMLQNNREHIARLINTVAKEEGIKYIRILNKKGEIIYSTDKTQIGTMLDKKAESCYACHSENEPLHKLSIKERTRIFKLNKGSTGILGVINPIYNEQSCWNSDCHAHTSDQTVLGVLDITVDLKEVERLTDESKMDVAIFAIIAILVIAVILRILVKILIQRPVRDLLKATNYVAVGNLSHRINSSRKDEIGKLADSFDNMTLKLAEARIQLFQSDKMASIGRLAAGVAHEINNPLTGVLTYSSFLLKRVKDNPEMKADLEVIVRETKRSREIVKGLLDFSRQSTPKTGKIELKEIVENTIAVIANQLKINHITLEKKYGQNIPQLMADANQIQQVFLNLLINAIDAIGKKGGTITIATKEVYLSPYGTFQIRNATCLNGHSLIDEKHKIDGFPSIKLKAKSSQNEGFIHLNPIYGKHQHHYGIQFNDNEAINLSCPQCGISLVNENKKSPTCGAPIYSLIIPGKGTIEGCTKFNCNWQRWDAIDNAGDIDFVEIKISDTGSGIEPQYLSKIFDPFYSTKGQKGTGLGLSVIWGIVNNHRGKITVDSLVNEGTTFTILLPVRYE